MSRTPTAPPYDPYPAQYQSNKGAPPYPPSGGLPYPQPVNYSSGSGYPHAPPPPYSHGCPPAGRQPYYSDQCTGGVITAPPCSPPNHCQPGQHYQQGNTVVYVHEQPRRNDMAEDCCLIAACAAACCCCLEMLR